MVSQRVDGSRAVRQRDDRNGQTNGHDNERAFSHHDKSSTDLRMIAGGCRSLRAAEETGGGNLGGSHLGCLGGPLCQCVAALQVSLPIM